MPRTKEENEKVKQARKERLVATSLMLLAEVGYKKTSMNEIAAQAHASHGLIYHYYPDKKALLEEIREISSSWKHIDLTLAQRAGSIDGVLVFASFFKEENLTVNEINLALFQLERGAYEKEKEVDAVFGQSPHFVFASLLEQAAREELIPFGDYQEKTRTVFDYLRGYLKRRLIAMKLKQKEMPPFNQSAFSRLISY